MTHATKPTRRGRLRIKNPVITEWLRSQNPDVVTLAGVFNTEIHSRRAMLKHAATFAGTVSDEVAQELGKPEPRLTVTSAIVPTLRSGDSLEERVNKVYRALVLIHAASSTDTDHVDVDDVLEAISVLADDAAATLAPVRHAPAEVALWAPEHTDTARPRTEVGHP